MRYDILIIILFGFLFLILALMKAVDIHKTDEEKMRDDEEQEEYIKQWRNKANEKNKSN